MRASRTTLLLLIGLGLSQALLWAKGLPPGAGAMGFASRAVALFLMQLAALTLVWSCSDRRTIAVILVFGAAFRVFAVLWPPDLSSDLHRYVWDARVVDSGRSPYAHPPAAPELSALRDPLVHPRINRPEAVTIYPPGAQAYFLAQRRVGVRTIYGVKAAAAACDFVSLGLLLLLLRKWKLPQGRLLVYAWSPLVISELCVSGHAEALVIPLVLGALLCWKKRPGWVGVAVGAAALVKLYPALLLLALRSGRRRAAATFALTVAFGYLPALAVSGVGAAGFLPRYFQSAEDFNLGLRGFLQAALIPLAYSAARPIAFASCAVALVAALVWVGRHRESDPLELSLWIVQAFLLLLPSAMHPWYAIWIVPLCALRPSWAWIYFAGAIPLSYLKYGSVSGEMPLWVSLAEWLPTYALLALHWTRGRRLAWETP